MASFATKLACVVLACMVIGAPFAAEAAAMTCSQVTTGLAPCYNYLKSGGKPLPNCCKGVSGLMAAAKTTADRKTACGCLKTAAKTYAGINQKFAAALPGACGVNIPYAISPSTDCTKVK
ncbi:hypothetical protein GIB67_041136 [Kingdonia uniflora]|uniref:Non-specific lipid-transfer protein n=1 Tax=Kingdonia uniflora TaxID=39325 RepID=A0A7J7LKL7_9MAGN|nr:hypothetical protein GIB67_041136 [Kingdonia uniflora]